MTDAPVLDTPSRREAMLAKIEALHAEQAKAVAGGGERSVARHHQRGRLLPRERIELLVDEGSAFLELSPLAAWGSDFPVGASVVTGIGVVEGVECLITANKGKIARRCPVCVMTRNALLRSSKSSTMHSIPLT